MHNLLSANRSMKGPSIHIVHFVDACNILRQRDRFQHVICILRLELKHCAKRYGGGGYLNKVDPQFTLVRVRVIRILTSFYLDPDESRSLLLDIGWRLVLEALEFTGFATPYVAAVFDRITPRDWPIHICKCLVCAPHSYMRSWHPASSILLIPLHCVRTSSEPSHCHLRVPTCSGPLPPCLRRLHFSSRTHFIPLAATLLGIKRDQDWMHLVSHCIARPTICAILILPICCLRAHWLSPRHLPLPICPHTLYTVFFTSFSIFSAPSLPNPAPLHTLLNTFY